MTAAAEPASAPSPGLPPLSRIVLAGLAGGAVDFLYACTMATIRGRTIEKLWQGVASGWLGKAAGDGGWATAGLGIVTHFGIAIVMALAYAIGARILPALRRRWLAWGALYGLVLYGVMYLGVLPLRFGNPWQWKGLLSVGDIAAHIGVALAIAWVLSHPRPR